MSDDSFECENSGGSFECENSDDSADFDLDYIQDHQKLQVTSSSSTNEAITSISFDSAFIEESSSNAGPPTETTDESDLYSSSFVFGSLLSTFESSSTGFFRSPGHEELHDATSSDTDDDDTVTEIKTMDIISPRSFDSASTANVIVGTTKIFSPPVVERDINCLLLHQCITGMKEYENKSLEELRLEDYNWRRGCSYAIEFGNTDSTLSRDLKNMFLSKRSCDAILKVKDVEFPVHRGLLESRSSVFANMFASDMKEKDTGTVNIADCCCPKAFKDFLLYIYSGSCENLLQNAFELYKISDKYDVQGLHRKARFCIVNHLTCDNVLSAFALGHLYADQEIINKAQDFFNKNMKSIFPTDKWKLFFMENCTVANKLLENMSVKVKLEE